MRNDDLMAVSEYRSHRHFTGRQLEENVLQAILKAGLESPRQWHFSVVQDPGLIQMVHDATAAELLSGRDAGRYSLFRDPSFQIFYYAPTVLFLFGEKESRWTQPDCGISVENMSRIAEAFGVGSIVLGLPRRAFESREGGRLRKKLMCPEGCDFVAALALGYYDEEEKTDTLYHDRVSRIP